MLKGFARVGEKSDDLRRGWNWNISFINHWERARTEAKKKVNSHGASSRTKLGLLFAMEPNPPRDVKFILI